MGSKIGFFDEVFEQGGSIIKNVVKTTTSAPSTLMRTAGRQIAPAVIVEEQKEKGPVKKETKEETEKKEKQKELTEKSKKTPQEQQRIEQLRQILHSNYYKDLSTPKKAEEKPAEKVEREDMEEKQFEFQKEKKKLPKLPINVRQGTGEKLTGVSG